MYANPDAVGWLSSVGLAATPTEIAPWELFALPVDEYYLPPTVAYSVKNARFVAVMPSFKDETTSCSTGYLNVAISTTVDPAAAWRVVRLPIGVYADVAWVGLSDDKAVITTNEWSLALVDGSCVGQPYAGARIRVVDLADLIDGASATFQNVTPPSALDYFNWYPVSAAPPPGSTSAGTTVDLAGEKQVGGVWGNVVTAKVTGSAKANTAVLTGLTDLTLGGIVPALEEPPAIPAIVNSAYFDERISAVAGRPGRLWFAANAACTPTGDTAQRACARFVELDTTTAPPTLVQDGLYGTNGSDTFLPAVGMAKDGKVFLRMTRALSAMFAALDQYVVQLAPNEAMDAGPPPVRFFAGSDGLHSADWAFLTTFALDPAVVNGVVNIGPAGFASVQLTERIAQFRGGLTADPSGAATVNGGRPWSNSFAAQIVASPLATSPIVTMRVSAGPGTETTTGGERLVQGIDLPLGPYAAVDVSQAQLGGTTAEGPHSAWIQFGTGDGHWSAPFERSFQVDRTPPVVTKAPTSGFATGYTVGTTAAVRTAWAGTDVGSGIARWTLNRILTGGAGYGASLPGTTTSVVHALGLGKTYRYDVQPGDLAGNPSSAQSTGPAIKPLAYQGTSTAIAYTSGFSTTTNAAYLGGSTRYATVAGKFANFTFTGRSVAFVSTKAKTRGKAYIYVDGVKKATVDMYSSTSKFRQIVWAINLPYGVHKVSVRVAGTAGRPRIDFDAFLKL